MGRASQEALPSRRPIFNLIGSLEGWYPTPTLTNRASRESRPAPRAPLFISRPPFFISRGGIFSRPPFLPPRAPRVPHACPALAAPLSRPPTPVARYQYPAPFFISAGRVFLQPTPFFSRAAPPGCSEASRVTRVSWGAFQGGTDQISPQFLSIKKTSSFLVLVVF